MRAITTSIFIATSKSAHYEAGRESCGGAAGCACDVDDIEKSAAQSFKGLLTAGAGFTVALGSKVQLRVEVQDFLTGFPNAVLTPPPGVRRSAE